MSGFHKLLQRQISKFLDGQEMSPQLEQFLDSVNASYEHFENDREMLERSIEISSEEMIELNRRQRQAHQDLKALFDNIEEVFFIYDLEQDKILVMSPACEKLYGLKPADFIAVPGKLYGAIVQEDRPTWEEILGRIRRGHKYSREYRIRHTDGSIRWVETRISPVKNNQGVVFKFDCAQLDITERKQAEFIVKESEARFRALFDESRDPILLLDTHQHFIDCNLAAVHILEAENKNQILLKLPKDFSPEFQPDGLTSAEKSRQMDAIAFQKGSHQFEWLHNTLSGKLIPIEVSLSRIRMQNQDLLLVHWRDISERKQAEAALRKQFDELRKTNEELDRFVYSVSHDLRAPLSSILGVIGIAMMDSTDEELLTHLRFVRSSAEKLDGFIADILDYSRNARTEKKLEPVDFTILIPDVIDNLKFIGAENRPAEIRWEQNLSRPFISDSNRLSIILNNLVSNAIRYQDPAKPQAFVHIKVSETPQGICMEVTDNGIGMRKDVHEKIFEMFYRVSDASVGSGLGLYIVKEAVQRLEGTIEVTSEPGTGTTFRLMIPTN